MGKCWVKFTEKKNVEKIVYIEIKMCDVNKPYISVIQGGWIVNKLPSDIV